MDRNLKGISYDDFVEFLFNSPYYLEDLELEYDVDELFSHYCVLLNHSSGLLEKYSVGQINRGFDAIRSSMFDCSLWGVVQEINIERYLVLIESMYFLFKDLFSRDDILGDHCAAAYMWGDCFSNFSSSPEDDDYVEMSEQRKDLNFAKIQDAYFKMWSNVLMLNSRICEDAALHGLNHVGHPETEKVLRAYLDKKKLDWTEEQKTEFIIDFLKFDWM